MCPMDLESASSVACTREPPDVSTVKGGSPVRSAGQIPFFRSARDACARFCLVRAMTSGVRTPTRALALARGA
jgi:hypothetical protein